MPLLLLVQSQLCKLSVRHDKKRIFAILAWRICHLDSNSEVVEKGVFPVDILRIRKLHVSDRTDAASKDSRFNWEEQCPVLSSKLAERLRNCRPTPERCENCRLCRSNVQNTQLVAWIASSEQVRNLIVGELRESIHVGVRRLRQRVKSIPGIPTRHIVEYEAKAAQKRVLKHWLGLDSQGRRRFV